jgi:hypothetical protein
MQKVICVPHASCGWLVQQGKHQKRFAYYGNAIAYALKLINASVMSKA